LEFDEEDDRVGLTLKRSARFKKSLSEHTREAAVDIFLSDFIPAFFTLKTITPP
jgi:hypothetical protein